MEKSESHSPVSLVNPNKEPYTYIGLARNTDGSITRLFETPFEPPIPSDSTNSLPVLTKDITINDSKKTYARVFLPRAAVSGNGDTTKFPVIVDFHGGGFVLGRPGSSMFQTYYKTIAAKVPVVIISIDYRLAPEHRLPAAYDDCIEGLRWLDNKTNEEEWLKIYCDFSKTFLMGCSAGGNIVYHVALRIASNDYGFKNLVFKGAIFHHPFFGGIQPSESEKRLFEDMIIPKCVTDIMWELSLPIGVDRDHEYCNPMVGVKDEILDQIKKMGWKIFVNGCYGDPLFDRQVEFYKMLENKDLKVKGMFEEGGVHGHEVTNPINTEAFAVVIKQFIME